MMETKLEQEKYVESSKMIIKEFFQEYFPDLKVVFTIPDLANNELNLKEPVMVVEFNASRSIDRRSGRNNGKGQRAKRKQLRFSFQIVCAGDAHSLMKRDRLVQEIEYLGSKHEIVSEFAKSGLQNIDIRFMNSYRVRENVHLSRLEMHTMITIVN